jgi:hypothetical protein
MVYFPTFVYSIDTTTNCHLSYEPLGCSAPLSTLHYVQPRCAPSLYPSEVSPSTCLATLAPAPVLVKDDDASFVDAPPTPLQDSLSGLPSISHPAVSPPGGLSLDISSLADQLRALADTVHSMSSPCLDSDIPPATPLPPSLSDDAAPRLLSMMPHDSILKLLHHEGSQLPSICPCDTANNSDTKMHWTAKEIHRIMGCCKF